MTIKLGAAAVGGALLAAMSCSVGARFRSLFARCIAPGTPNETGTCGSAPLRCCGTWP